jgi:membrane protein required for colicin V production
MDAFAAVSTLDWVLLAVLAVSVLVGLWRGIVFELMSLAAWLVAWWVAQHHADLVATWLPVWGVASMWRGVAAYSATFLGTLMICAVLARLARALIAASPLRPVDRFLGAGFGLVRGLLLLLVVSTVVMWTPAAQSATWRASQGAAWLGGLAQWLRPLWPGAPVAALLPSGLFFSFFTNGLHPCAASSA